MKKAYLILILMGISMVALSEPNRFVSKIGKLDPANIDGITQYFSEKTQNVMLEAFISIFDGSATIIVIDPKGNKVDTITVKAQMINVIQKKYKGIEGNWKIAVLTSNGKGNYVLKMHDRADFIGMDDQDQKYLKNGIAWYIDK